MPHIQKNIRLETEGAMVQNVKQKPANNKSPIQTKQGGTQPYASKEGQKPTIQAKQRPVKRHQQTGENTQEAQIKNNVSQMTGTDVSDAVVHYNSNKPVQLKAEATAQGNEVHLAPGKERHLGHELAHVAQQKQGIVKPTVQANNGISINNDPRLEKQADDIGAKAMQMKTQQAENMHSMSSLTTNAQQSPTSNHSAPMQLYASGVYVTKAVANLRNQNKEVIKPLPQGSIITVAPNAAESKFTTGFLLGSKNHIWVTDDQGNRGWIKEEAIGMKDTNHLVDTYARNKISSLPTRPGFKNFVHPDTPKYQSLAPKVKDMVQGIDISEDPKSIVYQLLENIHKRGHFEYNGTCSSELNYLSGVSGNTGDCQTLSRSIRMIMVDILGLSNVNITVKSKTDPFRVNNTKPLFDGTKPNRDDHWEFDNHYWLEVNGTEIDVLFKCELNKSDWQNTV